jgi:hypothetical protein
MISSKCKTDSDPFHPFRITLSTRNVFLFFVPYRSKKIPILAVEVKSKVKAHLMHVRVETRRIASFIFNLKLDEDE